MNLVDFKTDVLIDSSIEEIRVHAGFLRLYSDNEIVTDLPAYQIKSITLEGGNLNIPARLVKLCSLYSIPLYVLTNLHKHFGSLQFSSDPHVINRIMQYTVLLQPEKRLYLAKHIIKQKLTTQKRLVEKLGYDTTEILLLMNKIPKAEKIETLVGLEGTAARYYWQIYAKEIRVYGFNFSVRKKQDADDLVNSTLNLFYGLLRTQVQTSITLAGLDAYMGIVHDPNHHRPALVYDLMEWYRSWIVDYWILGMIQKKWLLPEDCYKTREGVTTIVFDKKHEAFRLWFKHLKYKQIETNRGSMCIQDLIDRNTYKLLEWIESIYNNKSRDRGSDVSEKKLTLMLNVESFEFEL